MTRYAVYFSGHVQGVNFRATTRGIARDHEAAGSVRNLPDGRVELVVEGEKPKLDAFVAAVQQRMSGFIRDTEMHEEEATGEFGAPRPGGVTIR